MGDFLPTVSAASFFLFITFLVSEQCSSVTREVLQVRLRAVKAFPVGRMQWALFFD